jgi:Tfp pilus assembly protein PilO
MSAIDSKDVQKIVVGLVLFIGIPVGLITQVYKPWIADTETLRAEVAETTRKIQEMKDIAARYDRLVAETNELDTKVKSAEKHLPRTRNLEGVLRTFTDMALRNRISVSSFAPGGDSDKGQYIEVPFAISFSASLHNLGKFLTDLAQQERIMSSSGLNLNSSLNPKRGFTVTGTFTLIAYVYKG